MKKVFPILSFVVVLTLMVESCTKNKGLANIDTALLNEARAQGFIYYQNEALLPGVAPSPHGSFKLRVNSVAASVLDSLGELPVGTAFPEGSLIVKDIYENGKISLYSIMKKSASSSYSGNGWIWAEIKPDGKALVSAESRGKSCISCHSGTPNRDLVRTYDLH